MDKKFRELRAKYPVFSYNNYHVEKENDRIRITYDFSIDGLCEFHPVTEIDCTNLNILNDYHSSTAQKILFSLGLVEAVSYWKCACPPEMIIRCGTLSDEDIQWWKKLYWGGLGEFFYRNKIHTDYDRFVHITSACENTDVQDCVYASSGINLIPVGGGKDSDVTMELLKNEKNKNMCFTVNNQDARTQGALAAGYGEDRIVKTFRTIDKELLTLNSRGFLNGHTPFSAIVAFLSYYCAYLIGGEHIILSNEDSANESNIRGTDINHQYSKSYAFECDFNAYTASHFKCPIQYFSLLRPFNELQIAKQFAAFPKFHPVFKSCNAGSKQNIWCAKCAKCLFVYIILSAFLPENELVDIFGSNMLDKEELKEIFDGLTGFSEVKPFECIGTNEEVNCALRMAVRRYREQNMPLPALLRYYSEKAGDAALNKSDDLLKAFNRQHNIPEKFLNYAQEMYSYVSGTD